MYIKKFISPFFLLISFLILIYVFYRSEIIWGGEKRTYYSEYYLISLILLSLSIISFYLKSKIKINISIIIISTLLILYSLEASLIIQNKHIEDQILNKKIELYQKKTGKHFDARKKIEIYDELKKEKNVGITYSAKTYFNEKKMNIFPLSGLSYVKTIHCNESGYFTSYESDRYGFNNPDENWDKKIINYLLAGDSFGNGACIDNDSNIAGNLKKLNTNNINILNLSYDGNGPLVEYASLREYMTNLKVKNVIWLYNHSDLYNFIFELKNPILKLYLDDVNFNQNLINKQKIIDKLVQEQIDQEYKKVINTVELISFFKLYQLRSKYQSISGGYHYESYLPSFKQLMSEVKKYVEKHNANLYFIYLPEFTEINSRTTSNLNRKKILSIINDLNIKSLDMTSSINQLEDPLTIFPFKLANHYNDLGYKIVANEIAKLEYK